MAVGYLGESSTAVSDRVHRSIALLRRRGYALPPSRLAELCLGGPVPEAEIRWIVAADPGLAIAEGLVVERGTLDQAAAIRDRSLAHTRDSGAYVDLAVDFIRRLVSAAPFVTSVSIAGSLASGGFRESDDVDLNLIVEDGHRHLAYVI